jgi:hypothetical protein
MIGSQRTYHGVIARYIERREGKEVDDGREEEMLRC